MSIAETMLPHFDQEIANTRRILEVVPSDKFAYKPHAKSMSLGQLASHTADLPNFLTVMVKTDGLELSTADFKPFVATSREDLLEHLASTAATARAALAGASDEHLKKTWTLTFKGKEVFGGPRTIVLPTTVRHLVHHRGQLTVYLRLNDVAFPGVYGPSADEMSAFA